MDIMEIVLLAAGGIIFVLSFFIPDRKNAMTGMSGALAEEEVRALVEQELEGMRGRVDDVAEEAAAYAMEKTERALERLSNEKIMAVGEYSDTVLSEIHRNHEEAMFLYDMLNNKHTSLKNTVSEVNLAVKGAEEKIALLQGQVSAGTVKEEKTAEEEDLFSVQEAAFDRLRPPAAEPDVPETARKEVSAPGQRSENPQNTEDTGRNNKERIRTLYREGKSTVDIAKELGLGVGEVSLVIDLFKD